MPQMSVGERQQKYVMGQGAIREKHGDGNVVTICQRERQKHKKYKFTKSIKHDIYSNVINDDYTVTQ